MMKREGMGRKKARGMLSKAGYASCGGHFARGGSVHSDEKQDEALIKREVKKSALKKLKDGGCADGGMAKPRADRLARGGKAKKHKGTTVNVIVGGQHAAPPMPVPKPVPVPVPAGPAAAPPPPGMAGPGGPPPPMGLKRGGRAKCSTGGNSQRDEKGGMPKGHFKRGGKTYPISDGAGGGAGRMEKAKAYGA